MKKPTTIKSISRKGGLATLKKHGREHFSKIATEMQAKRKELKTQSQK